MDIIDKAHQWLQENATMYRGNNASDCMIAAFIAGSLAAREECPELRVPDWCPLEDAPLTVPKIDSDICPNCEQPLMCGQDGLPFCFGCGYTEEEK